MTRNPIAILRKPQSARSEVGKMNAIFPLKSRNYKVSASVGVNTAVISPVRAILDTGAGPNLIRATVLPEDWERYRVFGAPTLNIVGAGGRRLRQSGTVTLHVEIGGIKLRARFLVMETLAAECILGCQFINRHVSAILPKEKHVRLSDGSLIPILRDSDPLTPPSSQEKSPAEPLVSTKVRIAKFTTVPRRSESHVWVNCQSPGLRFLQSQLKSSEVTGISMANGIADILPLQPFRVRVLNTSNQDRVLPKGMVLGHALPHPKEIVNLVSEESPPVADRPDVDGDTWKDDVDLTHLPSEKRDAIYQLLGKHRHMWDGRLGRVHATEHRIDLNPGSKPVHAQPYRAGPRAREMETQEVYRMLKAGVIEPASTEWASPVVLVPKPDGTMRFCVDYRKLNEMTIRDTYPLPRMDECIDSLGNARIFSTLDCNCGYWQIPLAAGDTDKTTFTCHEGTYRFLRMPFGLRNAPATFQRTVDIVLSGLKWKTCLVYLDDIIVFSNTEYDHFRHLEEVLSLLYGAGLSLKLTKCHFFKDTVDYLGHVIRPGKLEVAVKNTEALRNARPPVNQTELRSFLGLCNVYRRFVPGFAKIAAPLNTLLKKGESPNIGEFSTDQLGAFNALREKLLHPPVLALPRADGRYILDTDASAEQIGCCLLQEYADKTKHPIGFWSRSLNAAERNYSTTEKECLAIVWAILQLRPYLEGQKFLIRTDHHSLRWVLNLSDAQGRLARWRLRLLEFDFEVEYSPGKEHHGADTMSRLPPSPQPEVITDIPVPAIDTEIPCFTVTDELTPILLTVKYLRDELQEDASYDCLLSALASASAVDFDDHGNVGRVLPSGEFQLVLPSSIPMHSPVSVVQDIPFPTSLARRDARYLRRGEVQGLKDYNPSGPKLASPASSPVETAVFSVDPLPAALRLEEIIREQAADEKCQQYATTAGKDYLFDFEESGLLVRRAPLDGTVQIVVPKSLQARVLHLEHFPRTAGHPGVSRMFRSLRRRFFWPRMAVDVADTIRQCDVCSRNRIKERTRTSYLKLFPASSPLTYVSIDILGPLPKTNHGNRFLLVMTDRFSKLTRTVPLRSTSAYAVAKAFCDHWVFTYGPPCHVLTDNGPQFASKFFLATCRELGIEKVFSSAYHPQTNGQVERFNRTILNSLRGYVSERQDDWDEYTSALTFAYNCRIHTSLGLAPFELVLSRPPPTLAVESPEPGNDNPPSTVKLKFLEHLKGLLPMARRKLAEAQDRYKRNYDRRVRPKNNSLSEGSHVYVRREVHEPSVNPKLDQQVDGPYEVASNDEHTLLLRMGDKFIRVSSDRVTPAPEQVGPHAEGKEAVSPNSTESSSTVPPNEEPEYVVEKIVGTKRQSNGSHLYRIRWYGYGREEDTWEPREHLPEAMIRRYHRRTGLPN